MDNKKLKSSWAAAFTVASVWFGTHVGAGFATGNQVVNYFVQYGWTAAIFPLLAMGILAEASLSYVGLGSQPPATSLGLMLRDAQAYALLKPMLAVIPGLTILIIVVALNLAGDGLRDLLDPRLRRVGVARGAA